MDHINTEANFDVIDNESDEDDGNLRFHDFELRHGLSETYNNTPHIRLHDIDNSH
jgi:hypothetical protein